MNKPLMVRFDNILFFVQPGDSVFFNINGSFDTEKIRVSESNSDNYSYAILYDSLNRSLPFKSYNYHFDKGFHSFFDSISINNKVRLSFLNRYSRNHQLTGEFYHYALNQIRYSYYEELLYPVVYKNFKPRDLPDSYIATLNQIKLNNDSLVSQRNYAFAALGYIEYKKKLTSKSEIDIIQENSSGLTKEFLFTNYVNKMLNFYSSTDSILIRNSLSFFDDNISDSTFLSYYTRMKLNLYKYISRFTNDVQLASLINENGSIQSFSKLLNDCKDKVIILDFWASWCGPCIQGMPLINQLKQKYKDSPVAFIFISIDKTESDWEIGKTKANTPGSHFLLSGDFNSPLAKYLEIKSIPRYVIINRMGMLESLDAPHPIENGTELSKKIERLL